MTTSSAVHDISFETIPRDIVMDFVLPFMSDRRLFRASTSLYHSYSEIKRRELRSMLSFVAPGASALSCLMDEDGVHDSTSLQVSVFLLLFKECRRMIDGLSKPGRDVAEYAALTINRIGTMQDFVDTMSRASMAAASKLLPRLGEEPLFPCGAVRHCVTSLLLHGAESNVETTILALLKDLPSESSRFRYLVGSHERSCSGA